MQRSRSFDGLQPGASLGRLTSGLVAGAAGGLAFGALMLGHFTLNSQAGETSMLPLLQDALGTTSPAAVWGVHFLVSALLGVLFAALVAPRSYRTSAIYGLAYGLLAMVLGAQLLLRPLAGEPVRFDAGAALTLFGHLLYGLVLGLAYVAFHDLEVREAKDASSPRWRRWGHEEAHASEGRPARRARRIERS